VESLIVIVLLLGLLWVFIALPARRRQQQHRAMQDSVALGDEIITAGGMHGTVRELGDEELRVEIAPGVVVTLDRRAVAAVATDIEEVEEDGEEEPEEPDEKRSAPGRAPEAS